MHVWCVAYDVMTLVERIISVVDAWSLTVMIYPECITGDWPKLYSDDYKPGSVVKEISYT